MKTRTTATIAVATIAAGASLAAIGAGAADHLDAPGVQADGRTDLNDLYAFTSPGGDHTVLIMTVNPAAGVISGDTFRPGAEYAFNLDRDGDGVTDDAATIKFNGSVKEGQKFKVDIGSGPIARGTVGATSEVSGGGQVTAGTFEDPFFFDLEGFQALFDGNPDTGFTGDDFFENLDVSAIVLEVPNSWLGDEGDNVRVWASTSIDGQQIDRIGLPAINTVLIPADEKDAYNAASPADDVADYGQTVADNIAALGGDPALVDALLPDMLYLTVGDDGGFLNGRQLADDVIDTELGLLTGGAIVSDGVDGNDADFLEEFPYLAPANG